MEVICKSLLSLPAHLRGHIVVSLNSTLVADKPRAVAWEDISCYGTSIHCICPEYLCLINIHE